MSIPKDLLQEKPNLEEEINTLISPTTESVAQNISQDDNPVIEQEENLAVPDITQTKIVEEEEPVQLAMGTGFYNVFKGIKETASDAQPMYKFQTEDLVTDVRGKVFIRDATDEEIKLMDDIMGTGASSGTPKDYPIIRPNLDQIVDVDDIAQYQNEVSKVFSKYIEEARRGSVTVQELLNDAAKIGYDDMVVKIMKREKGTQFQSAAEVLKANIITIQSLFEAKRLANLVRAGKRDGKLTVEQTQIKYAQAVGFHSAILSSVSGNNAEVGRSLMILGHIKRYFGSQGMDNPENVIALEKLQELLPGIENIKEHANNFTIISDQYSSSKFAKDSTWLQKSGDVLSELWINSLLSSPVTHEINIFSNMAFAMYQVPETAVSGAIGGVRTQVNKILPNGIPLWPGGPKILGKGDGDRVYMGESYAKLYGMRRALGEATGNFYKVLKTEEPLDPVTKLDVRKRKAITAENLLPDNLKDTAFGKTVDIMGMLYRGPGRFLVAEDEWFKTLAYRAELHSQAYRHGMKIFSETGSKEEASRAAALFMSNPPPAIVQAAKDKATELTFQQELDGFLGNMQGTMSSPLAKIWIPFYKTPTNIMLELGKRSPLAVTMPSFWRDMTAGGAKSDAALGKFVLGTSLIAYFADKASGGWNQDIVITGKAPFDQEGRETWKAQGIEPYSIAFYNPETKKYTSIGYSRFEPLSGLLAISADYAWMANHSPNSEGIVDDLTNVMMHGGSALYNYMDQMPMLQAVAEVSELWGADYESFDQRIARAKQILGKQVGGYAINVTQQALTFGLAPESMVATYERYMDPTSSNVMAEDTTGGMFLLGWREAVQKWRSRNPLFSDDVQPQLSHWGEEVSIGSAEISWQYWTPFRIKESKYNVVDEYFRVNLNGGGFRMPPKTIEGIPLTATQYNKMIILMNTKELAIPGGKGKGNLLDYYKELITGNSQMSKSFKTNTLKGQKDQIANIRSMYLTEAQMEIKKEIQGRIDKRNNYIDLYGKSPARGDF